MIEQLVHRPLLHDAALLHHQGRIAKLVDHVQIVGDEQVAEVQFIPQFPQQFQNLGLNGHVQCTDRLVSNEEAGPLDQGHGDGHPLPLSAGKLRWLRFQHFLRQLHPFQHLSDPALALRAVILSVDPQRLL